LKRRVAVIDAPSNPGLMPPAPGRVPGVTGLPDALRAAGLIAKLDGVECGLVTPPTYSPEIDPATRIRNADAIRQFSIALAHRVEAAVESDQFPLVFLPSTCRLATQPSRALGPVCGVVPRLRHSRRLPRVSAAEVCHDGSTDWRSGPVFYLFNLERPPMALANARSRDSASVSEPSGLCLTKNSLIRSAFPIRRRFRASSETSVGRLLAISCASDKGQRGTE
jgi:hypothetical protein